MDRFYNHAICPDDLAADSGISDGGKKVGDLRNSGATLAEVEMSVIGMGSADGAAPELTPDMFSNCPRGHSDM